MSLLPNVNYKHGHNYHTACHPTGEHVITSSASRALCIFASPMNLLFTNLPTFLSSMLLSILKYVKPGLMVRRKPKHKHKHKHKKHTCKPMRSKHKRLMLMLASSWFTRTTQA